MKKLFFIAVFLLLASQSAFSQFFLIGPRVGVNSSNLRIDEQFAESGEAQLGFHAGIVTRISIAGFYIQPEAQFTNSGGQVIVIQRDQQGNEVGRQVNDYNFNRLDVPVMLGYKFAKVFRVQAGPSFTYLLSADVREGTGGQVRNVIENYNQATVGYRAGVGLDIWKFLIDLKYEGNLSRFGNAISAGGQSFSTDLRQNQFILSVGFNLFDL
jgi:hypothetical protein